ncbi:MAG: type II toxin-antitoxin system RelE/ParE family toxin [Bacteroidetes bacterium]|nr:MAG: type II toxin-antitoxin system RelE/ParE family toxin [Bacteroidota bacterium]
MFLIRPEPRREYYEYLKQEVSDEVARYVKNGILAKIKSLKDFAGYSHELYLEDEPIEYRSVSKWNYNIIYKVENDEVRVLNIIHTKRHPDKRKNV